MLDLQAAVTDAAEAVQILPATAPGTPQLGARELVLRNALP